VLVLDLIALRSSTRWVQPKRWPCISTVVTDVLAAQGIETVWVAFATGIMGQKTKYGTATYPDGNFTLAGRPVNSLAAPSQPLETAAGQVRPVSTK
jgi:hypothetical protein